MIPVIDMHCDTVYRIEKERSAGKDRILRENDGAIDLLRMRKGGYMCQCFALFTDLKEIGKRGIGPFEYVNRLSDIFDEEIGKNSDLIRPAVSEIQIRENFSSGYMSAFKTIEEGGVLEGKIENLELMYRKGVRKMTLTWNYENELGFPHIYRGGLDMTSDGEHGLKKAGFEMVQAMEEMGVIIDVSHLNDAGIRDVLDTVKPGTPVIASHSNARAVCGHPRNLPDEFLKKMAERGGIAGLNFCSEFLNDQAAPHSLGRISDMMRHLKYIRNLCGSDFSALGTDYDGIDNAVEIRECAQMQNLADMLSLNGFTSDEIEKIFFRNALRVYKEVLG